jgi:NitT/TauT family transport system ATP-binding protein
VSPNDASARASGLAVEFASVSRVFRASGQTDVAAVEGISLTVGVGELVVLVGPSGCGKSTLLRMAAGLDRPDAGRVTIGGIDTTSHEFRESTPLAYVFQDAHLLPWRNVVDNVALPLELAGEGKVTRREAASRAIAEVGLTDAAARYPAQLSGGMRMRVSLARALVAKPRVLLLDEPFGALDEITRHGLQEQLRQLWRATGITIVFVTHSIAEATFLAERVVVLTPRPARIVLDHASALAAEREPSLRTEPSFVAEMRVLQNALRGGGQD